MSDIIDINISPVVENVTLTIEPNLTTINVNTISGGGGIESVVAGDNISVDNTDPDNPIVSATGLVPYTGATSDVNLGEFGMLTGNLEFDNTPTNIPTASGSVYWNDSDGTLDLILKGGNVKLQVGQESVIRVVNKTASNINLLESNYQAVRVTGAQGQRLKVDLAQATTDNLSAETIGLVTENINNNQEGFITTSGLVRNINTTGSLQGETWEDGDILYLSPTVAGRITKVKPSAPNHLVVIGYVIHAHATQGSIFVKVDNGYELDELHNVKITTPLNNESLVYNSTLEVWENKAIDLQSVTDEGATTTNDITITDGFDTANITKAQIEIIDNVSNQAGFTSAGFYYINTTNGKYYTLNEFALGLNGNYIDINSDVAINTTNWKLINESGELISTTQKTTSFNAVNSAFYLANGTLTVTDPTPVTNKGYVVHVIGGTATIGGVAYTSGALVYRYYDGASWISTNMNSAITIDATPTDGSSNAVSSNGVFDALATKFELPALTSGSVLFSNGSTIAQDNSQLFWDDTNNRLGIGNASPQARLDVRAQGALSTDIAFRVRNSADSGNLVQVQGDGNIGIGTTSTPTVKLEVRGIGKFITGNSNPQIIIARNAGQGIGQIQFGDENGDNSILGGSQVSGFRYFSQTHHSFFNNTIESLRIFSTTRNVQIQNGGTFTDIPSARLAVNSTTQGFLPPRMTNAQRLAIASPAVGLIVYCTDATEGLYENTSTGWVNLNNTVTNRQVASYTLALTDASKLIETDVATANDLIIPLNSSVAFPIGTKIDVVQYGAGQTTFVATVGVTIRSANNWVKMNARYGAATLTKIGTDEWYLWGNLNA